jgi:DNA-binding transcriptional regulator LsrR (DeoR family)
MMTMDGWAGDQVNRNTDTGRAIAANTEAGEHKMRVIADLVAEQKKTRREIAYRMNLSLRSVDRYLRRARDAGLL